MKRSPMKPGKGFSGRSKPMNWGSSTLTTKTPMKRATAPLVRSSEPMRARKLVKDKPKRAARDREGAHYLAACRGQPCYLLVPGVVMHPIDTVVPAHSNQNRHGKGMGIKALDVYTLPACVHCHAEIDSGQRFTREEKFALWDAAYARWELVRAQIQQDIST